MYKFYVDVIVIFVTLEQSNRVGVIIIQVEVDIQIFINYIDLEVGTMNV